MFIRRRLSILTVVLSLFCLVFAASASANGLHPNGAKTPPPPDWKTGNILSVTTGGDNFIQKFEPWHEHLDSGSVNLTNKGNGTVAFSGTTYANKRVDTIGVRLTLQMWNGSSWIDVFEGPSTTNSNAATVSYNSEKSVVTGNYYRIYGYHWITKGTEFERGYTTGTSYLIN